jgi:hypothetical protein
MLKLLEKFNYIPPILKEGKWGNVEIKKNGNLYILLVSGEQWFLYREDYHDTAYEVFSHYDLAYGHVICTGMGLGVRENWLINNPKVTKVTVIERSQDLINYHYEINSPFITSPKVEIFKGDARKYKGKCDVLLLDHYELESWEEMLQDVYKCQQNIECDLMWFWPLEKIVTIYRKYYTDNIAPYNLLTKHQTYQLIKENYKLNKLPNIDESTLNLYVMMYFSSSFTNSEWTLNNIFGDRNIFNEVYKMI